MDGRLLLGLMGGELAGWCCAALPLHVSPIPETDVVAGLIVVVTTAAGGLIGVLLAGD